MNFEVNHYGDNLLGAVATEDLVEGRMVKLTSHTWNSDFGSKTDLPGVAMPDSNAESAVSHYIVAFAEDNRSLPIYQPNPAYSFALRFGFDQATNSPFSATVYLTHPGNMDSPQTIPSGSVVKIFGPDTIVTLPSGYFVHSSDLETPGATLSVTNTAGANQGKPYYSASNVVAEVIEFNSTNGSLTFRIK